MVHTPPPSEDNDDRDRESGSPEGQPERKKSKRDGDTDDDESDIDSVAEAGNGNLTDTEDDPLSAWDDDLGKNDIEGTDDDASGLGEGVRQVLAEALSYAERNEDKVQKRCDAKALFDALRAHFDPQSNATPREGDEPAAKTAGASAKQVEKLTLPEEFDNLPETEKKEFIKFFDERLKTVRDAFPHRWPKIEASPSIDSEKYRLLKIALACAMFWRPKLWKWIKEDTRFDNTRGNTRGDWRWLPDTDEKLVEMIIKLHFDEVHLCDEPILPIHSDLVTLLNGTGDAERVLFEVTSDDALDEFIKRTNQTTGTKIYEGTYFKTAQKIAKKTAQKVVMKKLPSELYRHGLLITSSTSPAFYNQLGGTGLKSGVGSSVYRVVHSALGGVDNSGGGPVAIRIFDAKDVKVEVKWRCKKGIWKNLDDGELKNLTHPFYAASVTSVLGTDESFVSAERQNGKQHNPKYQPRADLWNAACQEINAMRMSFPISQEVMAQRCMPTFVSHHKDLDNAREETQKEFPNVEKLFEGRRLGGVSASVMSEESGLTNMAKDATELEPTERDHVQAYNVLRDALFTKHSIMWKFRRGEAAASVALSVVKKACGEAELEHEVVNCVVQAVEEACAGALWEVTDDLNPDEVLKKVNLAATKAIVNADADLSDDTSRDLVKALTLEVDEIIPNACRLHLRSFDEFGSLGKMVVLAQVGSSLGVQRRAIIRDAERAFEEHSLDAMFFVVYGEDMANFLAKERISTGAKTKMTDQDKFRFRLAALCGLVPWKEVAPYMSPKCMTKQSYRALKHVRYMSWTLDATQYSDRSMETSFDEMTNALSAAFERLYARGKLPGVLNELNATEEDHEGAIVERESDIVILAMRTSDKKNLERTHAAQRQLTAMMFSLQRVADKTGEKPFKEDAKILLATMVGSKMNVDDIGAMIYYDPEGLTQGMLHKFFNPDPKGPKDPKDKPEPATDKEWKQFYERFAENVILPAIDKCKTRYSAPENGSENDTINLGDFARYIPRDAYANMRDVVTELVNSAHRSEDDVAKKHGIRFVSAFQDRLPFHAEKKLLEEKQSAPVIAFYSPEAAALATIGNKYTSKEDEDDTDEDAMYIPCVYPSDKTSFAMIRLVGAIASVGTAEYALFGALQGVGERTSQTRKESYRRTSWGVFELITQGVNELDLDLIPGYSEPDASGADEEMTPDLSPNSSERGTPDTFSPDSKGTADTAVGELSSMSISTPLSSVGEPSPSPNGKTAEETTTQTETVKQLPDPVNETTLPDPVNETTLLAVFRVSRKNASVAHQELRLQQWLRGKDRVRNGVSFKSKNGTEVTEVTITDVIVILLDGVKGTTPVGSVAVQVGGVKFLRKSVVELLNDGFTFDRLFSRQDPLTLGLDEWKNYLLKFRGDVFVATVSRIANPGTVGLLVRRATIQKRRTFVYDVIMAYQGEDVAMHVAMREAILHGTCHALNLEVPRVAIWLHFVALGAELWRYAQRWRFGRWRRG